VSENRNAEELQKGIEAARAGDKTTAREIFEKVLENDDKSEKAWFWLASVVETDEDRRVALSNVVYLNPNNERAKKALELLDAKNKRNEVKDEIIPGVSRRTATIIGAVAAGVLALVLLLFLGITLNNNRVAADAQATVAAQTQAVANANSTATGVAVVIAQTQAALTPTPANLAQLGVATLPPTFTPTAGPTNTPEPVVLPFPTGLVGNLAAWAGRDVEQDGYLPVGIISLTSGAFTALGNSQGTDTSFSVDATRLIYTLYQPTVFTTTLQIIPVAGGDPENLDQRWLGSDTIFDPKMPTLSPNGDFAAFIGRNVDATTDQLFLLSLGALPPAVEGAAPPSPVRRLSNDNLVYSFPAYSPSGTQIAVVRGNAPGSEAATDIVLFDIATGSAIPVTSDQGAFIESSPQWSGDGTQIVYAAAPSSEPNNADIAVRFPGGGGTPTLIARDPANDIFPVFSPDGRYIAFSSNRGGQYDIYVFDQATQTLFQLTNTPEDEFTAAWR
jgi:WD40-like Beta Propeller Repeat